jgi:D-glycero-D-manno-heptose 1,7-bisphosphate phosphatase
LSESLVKYVFLDRDGTLIRHVPYLSDPRQVELLPTVIEGLAQLRAAGCRLILHSNQSGVGRGYFPLEAALACNEAMLLQIGMGPDLFVETCICPEAPGQDIVYRKPSPRFAREVMSRHGVTANQLVYIGDNASDLETAKNVGCAGVGVATGVHDLRDSARAKGLGSAPIFESFLAAARYVLTDAEVPHAVR